MRKRMTYNVESITGVNRNTLYESRYTEASYD